MRGSTSRTKRALAAGRRQISGWACFVCCGSRVYVCSLPDAGGATLVLVDSYCSAACYPRTDEYDPSLAQGQHSDKQPALGIYRRFPKLAWIQRSLNPPLPFSGWKSDRGVHLSPPPHLTATALDEGFLER